MHYLDVETISQNNILKNLWGIKPILAASSHALGGFLHAQPTDRGSHQEQGYSPGKIQPTQHVLFS